MTNNEYADTLEKLAGVYREPRNENLKPANMWFFCDTKEELIAAIKAIGGKWIKTMPGDQSDEYSTVHVNSVDFAPLKLHIYRNRVCHKTVTWDCEPFLSPEDEQEVDGALAG